MALNNKNATFDFNNRIQPKEEKPPVTAPPIIEREKRSRRGNILVKPSVYDKVMLYANQTDQSFNDIVNRLLEEFVEKNKL